MYYCINHLPVCGSLEEDNRFGSGSSLINCRERKYAKGEIASLTNEGIEVLLRMIMIDNLGKYVIHATEESLTSG